MAGDKVNRWKRKMYLLLVFNVLLPVLQTVKVKSNHQRCSRPSEWIPIEKNVCYGMGKQQLGQIPFGKFFIKGNHSLVALRLVHISGDLTCPYNQAARWGCRKSPSCSSDCFTTIVYVPRLKLYSETRRNGEGLFTYPGFTIDDDVLIIKFKGWPNPVKDGDEFVISSQAHNLAESGVHCVDVDASFLI